MPRPSLLVGASLVLGLVGCGGGGGGGKSSPTTGLSVTSTTDRILPGGTVPLTAFVQGGGGVTWSVEGGDANGTVTSSGLYTAPTAQGAYTVRATSGDQSATKTITVTTGVTITPASTAATPLTIPRSKLSFAATVAGATDKTVLWSVKDATGTAVSGAIATDGTFTAPDATGTYTVVGASKADPTKTTSASVQVVANVNVRMGWQDRGIVVLSLRPDKAPTTAANFVTLVNKGFYNGILLHRKAPSGTDTLSVIQFGDPLTKTLPLTDSRIGSGGPGYTIPFEENDLSNVRFSLAMARSESKDSGGSQVYINLADQPTLDHTATNQGYVVFGAVAEGADIVQTLVKGDKISGATVVAAP